MASNNRFTESLFSCRRPEICFIFFFCGMDCDELCECLNCWMNKNKKPLNHRKIIQMPQLNTHVTNAPANWSSFNFSHMTIKINTHVRIKTKNFTKSSHLRRHRLLVDSRSEKKKKNYLYLNGNRKRKNPFESVSNIFGSIDLSKIANSACTTHTQTMCTSNNFHINRR